MMFIIIIILLSFKVYPCGLLYGSGTYPDHEYIGKINCGILEKNQGIRIYTKGEYPNSVWLIFPKIKGYHNDGINTGIIQEHKGNYTLPCYHEGSGDYGFEILTSATTFMNQYFIIGFEKYDCE